MLKYLVYVCVCIHTYIFLVPSTGLFWAFYQPPLVANRKPKNLKDLLVKAMMKPPQQHFEGKWAPVEDPAACIYEQASLLKAPQWEKDFKLMLPLTARPKTSFI